MTNRLRRNGNYTVTLSQAEVFKVCNALIEDARKLEEHAAAMKADGKFVSAVWAIEIQRDKDLANKIRETAEFVKRPVARLNAPIPDPPKAPTVQPGGSLKA